MEELIQKLQDSHGITAEQGHGILSTIKDYVKEKFPMLGGAVDNMFASTPAANSAGAFPVTDAPKAEESMFDKISDEDFAKNAAHKAEDVFDSVKDKFSGMFGGDKK